jgi:hypothetical protein
MSWRRPPPPAPKRAVSSFEASIVAQNTGDRELQANVMSQLQNRPVSIARDLAEYLEFEDEAVQRTARDSARNQYMGIVKNRAVVSRMPQTYITQRRLLAGDVSKTRLNQAKSRFNQNNLIYLQTKAKRGDRITALGNDLLGSRSSGSSKSK